MRSSATLPTLLLLLTACGDKPSKSGMRHYRLEVVASVEELRGRGVADGRTVVVAAADRAATAAAAVAGAQVVAIGDAAARSTGFDALVLDETGAATAVDLALLACNGVALPTTLPIGTRVFSRADAAAGGAPVPAPGDPIAALLRQQHAAILTTTPATDEFRRVGLLQFRSDDHWHARVARESAAAAKRYPQLELTARSADGDPARQDTIAREFVTKGFRAILVTTDDPATIAIVARQAQEREVAVIVIDALVSGQHGTCCVGCDRSTIGRAVAKSITQLLPDGGSVLELEADPSTPRARRRHRSLAEALGVQ